MPSITKLPTADTGTTVGDGSHGTWAVTISPGVFSDSSSYWLSQDNTTQTDSGSLVATGFGFNLNSKAIIDGIQIDVVGVGFLIGVAGIGPSGGEGKDAMAVAGTYGGPNDLWGASFDYNDINNLSVSFSANAAHDPADASASISSLSVTIYYHLGGSDAPADVPTREVYKVYNQRGNYIGNLPTPTAPLKIAQDINNLGSQITVNIPVGADTSGKPSEPYTTEDASANYTTEDGANNYNANIEIPIVSAGFQSIDTLIKNGNTVQAWLYNYFYPNGKCMFIGKIRRWEADFGDDNSGDSINIVLYSKGYDLDNYITRGLPFNLTNDQTQTAQNKTGVIQGSGRTLGNQAYGQSFKIASATNIGGITVKLKGSADVTLELYDAPNGNLLASSQQHVNTAGVAADVVFYMPTPISVTPGSSYFFGVSVDYGQSSITIYYQNSNVYANGTAYNLNQSVGWGVLIYGPITGDLYFKVASGIPNTTTTFSSKDPSTEMLAPILDDYIGRGGSQIYTATSIDATGLSLTYIFKVQTVYEALQAILSLAPAGFYYYVDLGSQTIYFKNQSTTPDFMLTKGVEINSLSLITTTENVVNDLLFTGGDTGGGVNLYKEYNDSQSIGAFGILLDRKTDSRVTLTPTADAIGVSEIAQQSGEQYQTTITLAHTTRLDITQLVPGKTVGLRGFGTFVDNIIAQIVHREWSAESVTLTLGVLPVRLTYAYERTTRQLIAQQTQDNPTSPS